MGEKIIQIEILSEAGVFAENKDVARLLREERLLPALARGDDVLIDFAGVSSATQSFVHALVSEAMRKFGAAVLDRIQFKDCNETIRQVIQIVAEYMQQSDAA